MLGGYQEPPSNANIVSAGAPWELIKEFEVSAEHIAQQAVELLAVAKMKSKKKSEERLQFAH